MPQIIKEVVNDDQETKTEEEIKLREEEMEIVNDVQDTKTENNEITEENRDLQECEEEIPREIDSDPDFTGYTEEELQGVKRVNIVSAPTSPTDCLVQSDVDSSTPQLPRRRSNSIGDQRAPRLPPRKSQKSALNKNEEVKIGRSPSRSQFRKSVEELRSKALKKMSKK